MEVKSNLLDKEDGPEKIEERWSWGNVYTQNLADLIGCGTSALRRLLMSKYNSGIRGRIHKDSESV